MKRQLKKPAVLAVLSVAIYVFGLFFGAFAVNAFPYYYKQKAFFDVAAADISQNYLDGSTDALYSSADSNLHIYLHDETGTLLHHVKPIFIKEGTKPISLHEKHISKVLSGKEIYRLSIAKEMPRFIPDILAVSGIPIQKDGTVVGAIFFVKNLVDLPATLSGYIIYFTLFYWLTIFFFVTTLRKKKKLEKLQQNYIANITHALKTPIASIRALTEILCDDMEPDPEEKKVYYGMILSETSRQEHMVRDVLELSKLQSNGTDFSKTKVDVPTSLEPILEKYSTLCDCSGIAFHVSDTVLNLPPVNTNAACFKQILEILLDNAIKFVPEGGAIWLEASVAWNQATFCVRDNGIGIAPDVLPHVFDRFFKGQHDFNTSGSGLGLAIAKELAAGLNEKIWAESKLNEGAAFYFTLHLK